MLIFFIFLNYFLNEVNVGVLQCFNLTVTLHNVNSSSNNKLSETFSNDNSLKKRRNYMADKDKHEVSKNVPEWLDQVVCGLLLSDATLRFNGKHVLMGIQQTHEELTKKVWQMCFDFKLVLSDILIIQRKKEKPVYSFQTLTLPYFTNIYNEWYYILDGKRFKKLPSNLEKLFTPLAFAFLIMGDGGWDKHSSWIVISTNWFTLDETKKLQSILLIKFNINSYLVKTTNSAHLINRGYIIKIPHKEVYKVRELLLPYIYPTLQYKLGL